MSVLNNKELFLNEFLTPKPTGLSESATFFIQTALDFNLKTSIIQNIYCAENSLYILWLRNIV